MTDPELDYGEEAQQFIGEARRMWRREMAAQLLDELDCVRHGEDENNESEWWAGVIHGHDQAVEAMRGVLDFYRDGADP